MVLCFWIGTLQTLVQVPFLQQIISDGVYSRINQTLDNSSFQHLIGIGLVLEAEGGGLFIRAT